MTQKPIQSNNLGTLLPTVSNVKEELNPKVNYIKQEQIATTYCYKPYRTLQNY